MQEEEREIRCVDRRSVSRLNSHSKWGRESHVKHRKLKPAEVSAMLARRGSPGTPVSFQQLDVIKSVFNPSAIV